MSSQIFTTGAWKPSPGKEDAFLTAWAEFATWASGRRGAGTLSLTRDVRDPERFVSFGTWASIEAVRAWKSAPDFRERLAQVLQYVHEFERTELAVVVTARSGSVMIAAEAA